MSAVIERGEARCPRCSAVAAYSFHESDGGALRYEVACPTCGHVHREPCASPPALVA